MKKRFFGLVSAAVFAISSVPFAAYADDDTSNGFIQGKTPDGTYDYEVFNDMDQGQIQFDGAETNGGCFSCKWDETRNSIFGKGHNIDMPDETYHALGTIECTYEMEYSATGISKYGGHGWMKDLRNGFSSFPLVEYFIIDGFTEWRPCEDEKPLGQVIDHGCTYDIYAQYHSQPSADMAAQFVASYFSIIRDEENPVQSGSTATVSHTIDMTKHFEAWEKAGLNMNYTILNAEFYMEGWKSSGAATVTKNDVIIGAEQIPDTTTAPVTTTTITTYTTAEENDIYALNGSYQSEIWNDENIGTVTFDDAENDGGSFSCKWNEIRDFFFTKGHRFDTEEIKYQNLGNIRCDYEIDFSANDIAYYGIHGWMTGMMPNKSSKLLVEYYIIDGYNKWTPTGQLLGEVVDNGCTYDIYSICKTWSEWAEPEQYLYQYLSVIRAEDNPVQKDGTATGSHKIDIAKHFKAWADAGLDMDTRISDVSFIVEGLKSSGEAKVKQSITNDSALNIERPDETSVQGDVNSDGVFSVSDIVLLQKWLAAVPDTNLKNWKAADLSGDGILNSMDLTLCKQRILSKMEIHR